MARHYAAVSAVAFATTRDLSLSEDVAQDTFIAAWTGRGSIRDLVRVRPWPCGIARNLSRNALRRRREVAFELDAPDGSVSALDTAIDHDTVRELHASLAEIPARYREPLVLFSWEDQSLAQVASALAISEAAAQKRISSSDHFFANLRSTSRVPGGNLLSSVVVEWWRSIARNSGLRLLSGTYSTAIGPWVLL